MLAIDGRAVEAIPLYDCTYTDGSGISGYLGEIGSGADVGVVSAFPMASSSGGGDRTYKLPSGTTSELGVMLNP